MQEEFPLVQNTPARHQPRTTDTKTPTPERYRAITRGNINKLEVWNKLEPELREVTEVVSAVLPFKTNEYVVNHLIDWDRVPADPVFQLTFPQKGMLDEDDYDSMLALTRSARLGNTSRQEIEAEADRIRAKLNPHPSGQLTHNVPTIALPDGSVRRVPGMQHKYAETVLFFPSHGQTCHAYCTFCFRWAQFIGKPDIQFANREAADLVTYLHQHPEVTDVLITGGDPMVMTTKVLAKYLEPILDIDTVDTIRIGTKSVSYWPQRYVTDNDADELLRLFDRVVAAGKHLSIMGHYCHPNELRTELAQQAVRRIRTTGANVRMQSPMVRNVNDNADAWARLWREGVKLGAIPYYFFVERDTGAKRYFEIPLAKCWDVFRDAYQQVSGMARTVRGPSMSAFPGKCHILGVTEIAGQKAFVLEFLQARDPALVRRPFFAKYDENITWYDELEPLSEHDRAFFPDKEHQVWGQPTTESAPLTLQGRSITA